MAGLAGGPLCDDTCRRVLNVKSPSRLVVLLTGAFLVLAVPSLVTFYLDWLWFGETGYQRVFLTTLGARARLGAIVLGLGFLWLFVNFRIALTALRQTPRMSWSTREGLTFRVPAYEQLGRLVGGIAAGLGIIVALFASSQWLVWLAWRHASTFGVADPILGRDVAFYVFTLPVLERARAIGLMLVVFAGLGAGAIYAVAGGVGFVQGAGLIVTRRARRHLSLLVALLLVLLAFGAWLDIFRQFTAPSGIIHGASYADVAARFPAARALAAVALAGAALAAYHAFARAWWPIPLAFTLYVLAAVLGRVSVAAVQRFIVAPNEQVRETPYIAHNIDATRRAFALDRVATRVISGDAALAHDDIAANRATLDNVRLWDHQPLLETFGQIQEIRTYYDFVSVDNDRYEIGGEYRQIMLSARELNSAALPNRTWINEHLTFTHGYGLTLGPVNQVAPEGLPVLLIRNIPPEAPAALPVSQPAIYFGELSNEYVFVKTRAREFHYPRGDDNEYTTYSGNGGIPVGSLARKVLLSMRFASLKILLSNDITPESRVLFNRRLRDRVTTIAPFLEYDDDPYLVLADGRLFWIQDAYTVTGRYPYSTVTADGINYIRNAVKVVVDAYHGTTTYYVADTADPLAATYARIFPTLFKPFDAMPELLQRHLRYPEGIFTIQAGVYATYHMTNPAVFYNKEDQWEVPSLGGTDDSAAPMQPYYTIMRLPGEQRPEFIQMLPFTPRRKDNLAAWLVARSDEPHAGRLAVFQFPKQKVVFGPRQVVARISQDQVISPQITLWNQQGSQVILGTLLVIPIEESLIYVQPLYLRGTGSRIPELKRVIVAHQNRIVMAETLEASLDRLFGPGPSGAVDTVRAARIDAPALAPADASAPSSLESAVGGTPRSPDTAALATQARDHYQRAIAAQRAGDWTTYGDELKRLGEVLERLSALER
jgi:uncharacterized membrane protein (UPF0182 family)